MATPDRMRTTWKRRRTTGGTRFTSMNAGYVADLYDHYRTEPSAVPAADQEFLARVEANDLFLAELSVPRPLADTVHRGVDPVVYLGAAAAAEDIRHNGHLSASFMPLQATTSPAPPTRPEWDALSVRDLNRGLSVPLNPSEGSVSDALARLWRHYTGSIAFEVDHLRTESQCMWWYHHIEGTNEGRLTPDEERAVLWRLTEVEQFEQFLHRTFPGQKRFSIEGVDMLVPMLDRLIAGADQSGIEHVAVSMAHRGRLNVLVHVLGKPYQAVLREFQAALGTPREPSQPIGAWTGDAKYHLGWVLPRGTSGRSVEVLLANNPSHLEFINPVLEGMTRALQDDRTAAGSPSWDANRALPVMIHGDAAFMGEGVVAETLNLARLPGYATGGTIHIILDNAIGFTTLPEQGRSTLYSSDLAKGFDMPIIHVSADDPSACLRACRLALEWRQQYHQDVMVNLHGYRRWGHNEGDDPAFTEPVQAEQIRRHPTVRALWQKRLEASGAVTADDADAAKDRVTGVLQDTWRTVMDSEVALEPPPMTKPPTAVRAHKWDATKLKALGQKLLADPPSVHLLPKLGRIIERERDAVTEGRGIDWGLAESLAFGSILEDGVAIRLAGQDTERGTFSQRHAVWHDKATGLSYMPLQHLEEARAAIAIYNSPLSEVAGMGFEYGYDLMAPETLVLWEAQFGDFANSAQVIIDQFLAAALPKWQQASGLVLLLPHGYDGQGPEHSSARLERFLELAAQGNWQVCYPSGAAQYFHLLRRQAFLTDPRPLVVLTGKSLFRHPEAAADLKDLADGQFERVRVLSEPARKDGVRALVMGSGKVMVELDARMEGSDDFALLSLDQIYPWPESDLKEILAPYAELQEVRWLQEEPENMGAWTFVQNRLRALLPEGVPLKLIARPASGAPSEGWAELHAVWQEGLLSQALAEITRKPAKTLR